MLLALDSGRQERREKFLSLVQTLATVFTRPGLSPCQQGFTVPTAVPECWEAHKLQRRKERKGKEKGIRDESLGLPSCSRCHQRFTN